METRAEYEAGSDELRIRDARTERRFFVDNVIIRGYGPTLGVYGVAVYSTLCMHANLNTQEGFPSHSTIADLLDCSVGKVKDSIRLLEKLGLIHVEPRYEAETHRQTSNLYTILEPPMPPVTTDTPPRNADMTTNNPHSDQSSINGGGADAQHAPDDSWPEDLAHQERAPSTKARLPKTSDPLVMAAHCASMQAIEGDWTVPKYNGLSPQCAVIKKATGLSPDQAIREVVDETVPNVTDALYNLFKVAQGWVLCGYNKRNVGGILECYREGRIPSTKPEGGKGNGGSSGPRQEVGANGYRSMPSTAR